MDNANDVGAVGVGGYLLQIGIGDPSFTIPSWVEGMTLWVRVLFEDDTGQSESVHSEEVELTPVAAHPSPTVPDPPIDLMLTPGDSGELDMKWVLPAYGDGGSMHTGWKVQWKGAADSWGTAADVSEHRITVDDSSTFGSYTITGLTDGTAVSARVIATNRVGDSEPSAEMTATPGNQLSLSGLSSREFEEGGWSSLARIRLPQPDGTPVIHDLADQYRVQNEGSATIEWSLSGDDADDFTIYGTVCTGHCRASARSGSSNFVAKSSYAFLNFAESPNYESPTDAGGDNVYELTVQATDGTNTVTMDVTVEVTDVDESDGTQGCSTMDPSRPPRTASG